MVTVKDAVKGAGQFVADLFPDAKGLRLEQVENGGMGWRVVMSFYFGEPPTGLTSIIGGPSRLFKEVDVDKDTGEGTALRVWNT